MNPNENPQWQYKSGGAEPDPVAEPLVASDTAKKPSKGSPDGPTTWKAAEYIEHERAPGWYTMLAIGTVVLSAATYLITKDYFATGIILVLGFIVGFAARHKPRQLEYEVSDQGLRIGTKTYPYTQFKSFSVIQEGSLTSINMVPVKRLMPMVTAYFDSKDQDRIVSTIGNYLPFEERQMDGIDRLTHRLRF